ERYARAVDDNAHAGGGGDAPGVAPEAIGDVDHGVQVFAERVAEELGLGEARLEGEMLSTRERVADAPGDPELVAGPGGGAQDWTSRGVRVADDGDAERERGAG